jgi:hypothetical protein
VMFSLRSRPRVATVCSDTGLTSDRPAAGSVRSAGCAVVWRPLWVSGIDCRVWTEYSRAALVATVTPRHAFG